MTLTIGENCLIAYSHSSKSSMTNSKTASLINWNLTKIYSALLKPQLKSLHLQASRLSATPIGNQSRSKPPKTPLTKDLATTRAKGDLFWVLGAPKTQLRLSLNQSIGVSKNKIKTAKELLTTSILRLFYKIAPRSMRQCVRKDNKI